MKHIESQTGPYELNNFDSFVACDVRNEVCDLGVNLEEIQASPSDCMYIARCISLVCIVCTQEKETWMFL